MTVKSSAREKDKRKENLVNAKDRIIVALDVPTQEEALHLVGVLSEHVGMFKIGIELFDAEGPSVVRAIQVQGGRVLLDLKLHDIPNTVAGAARSISRLGAAMFTVHASGGVEMMRAAKESAGNTIVLGITVLTSIDQQALGEELRVSGSVGNQVVHLARLAQQAGLTGVVCSPREVKAVRRTCAKNFLIVTPGIRPSWAAPGDQRRVAVPAYAIAEGADYLVIGRPITRPPKEIGSPVEAAKRIAEEIAKAV